MKKKIISAVLAGSMLIALSGCSITLGNPYSEEKTIAGLEKSLEAEEIDSDDMLDILEEEDFGECEDGVYAKMSKKENKKAYNTLDLNQFFPGVKKVESAVSYLKTNDIDNQDRYVLWITSSEFTESDDARDFFDDTLDIWEDLNEDFDFGDSEKLSQAYFYYDDGRQDLYGGIYMHGKRVISIICVNDPDDMDAFCHEMKINSPSSVED